MFRVWRRFPCVGVVTKTKLWKGFSYGLYFLDRGGLGTKLSCPGLACNTENREWEWVRTGYGGQHLEVLVQEDHCEFDSSLSYKARPYLKWNKNKNPTATKPDESVNKVFTTHKNIRIEAWIPRIPVKLNVYTVIPVHLQQHGKLGSLLAGDMQPWIRDSASNKIEGGVVLRRPHVEASTHQYPHLHIKYTHAHAPAHTYTYMWKKQR